jgi:hypothetical protein
MGCRVAALKAQPFTAAGAAALLLYVAESIAAWEPNLGDILPALVNAARAIAGPPVVSMQVQEALDGKNVWLCASELPAPVAPVRRIQDAKRRR